MTGTLIYFPARGRAELIRLILAEAGVDYVEHHVGMGTPPVNGRPTDFAALKASGQLAFEAVPVWEDSDGFRLAQSLAIANHLARTHGLAGQTHREQAQVEQALGGYDDARAELRKLMGAPKEQLAALRAELVAKTLPRWFGYFERLLKTNGTGFLVGAGCTSADLALWYLVEACRDNELGAAITGFPLVGAHFERIGQRPKVAAYVGSAKRPAFTPLPK